MAYILYLEVGGISENGGSSAEQLSATEVTPHSVYWVYCMLQIHVAGFLVSAVSYVSH